MDDWRTIGFLISIIGLCLLLVPVARIEPGTREDLRLFEAYVMQYDKPYKSNRSEYERRFVGFQKSLRNIEALNGQRVSELGARYGLTSYSDMTDQEFLARHLRPDTSTRSERHLRCPHHRVRSKAKRTAATTLPARFDWRDMGVVTPVKNQGDCGACWAFSVVEVAESMYAMSNKTLRAFSTQEMIDCAGNNNLGCDGGDVCSLLDWLLVSGTKILPEANYPLTRRTDACKLHKDKKAKEEFGIRVSAFTCDSFVDAEEELAAEVAGRGPVAVAVNALPWQNYIGGIMQSGCDGSFTSLNHAVQVVGYDATGPIPHYIVRNSWGSVFGDHGYAYLAMGGNVCGIADQVASVDIVY